jgi:hypothetical protein
MERSQTKPRVGGLWIAVWVALILFHREAQADIMYLLDGQATLTLTATGTITTDGFIGLGDPVAHVIHWNVWIDNGPALPDGVNLTPANSSLAAFTSGWMYFSESSLRVDSLSTFGVESMDGQSRWIKRGANLHQEPLELQHSREMAEKLAARSEDIPGAEDWDVIARTPEPGSFVLALIGLACLVGTRFAKRNVSEDIGVAPLLKRHDVQRESLVVETS